MLPLVALLAANLQLAPCTEGRAKVPASCGTFRVYEDRTKRSGRTIALHVIILHAKSPSNRAIYFNPGGPGGPTLPSAPGIADGDGLKELAVLRDRYNIILIDNRGMGDSHPLQCNLRSPGDPTAYLRQLWPNAAITACRAKLSADSDLSAYNTVNAVDDLDDLRAALGYPKLVFDAGSYGTYFALIYMQRHPSHVESAVLQGVVPPDIAEAFLGFAGAAQSAMDKLVSECRTDALCQKDYPQFATHFAQLIARLNRGPIPVRIPDPATKRAHTVMLSKEVFGDSLRHLLYDINLAVYVPYFVERAYHGDTLPLGTAMDDVTQAYGQGLDQGAFLSYSCAEYVPFITQAQISASSAGTFMGDTRIRAQQQACSIWNVPPLPPSARGPVRSSAPILMVSGTNDPATPPQYSAEQLRYLPNARRVLIAGASHDTETQCADDLIVAFVRRSSAQGLAVNSCRAAYKRPAFATSMTGFGQ
jgi:pimeloyl-ACP methyl ester carboxylesterase